MKNLNVVAIAIVLLLAGLGSSAGFCQARGGSERLEEDGNAALFSHQNKLIPPPIPRTETGPDGVAGRVDVHVLDCRLPGEFERQRALLLACSHLLETAPDLLVEIARHAAGKIDLVLLVSNVADYTAAKRLLRAHSIPTRNVRFAELPHDTMWARDYGPMIAKSANGSAIVIDAVYDVGRPNDDLVPTAFANLLNLPVVQMPLRVDGGNLLSNGAGLAITTNRLFEENNEIAEESVRAALRGTYGLTRVVVLEPLIGEPTGHVDMFATFTSSNTVVVGQYDPAIDGENAAILDRNAEKLAQTRTAKGPLRVVRVPMLRHDDGNWRTYTNVIFANGVLMVPTYAGTDSSLQRKALATYAKLLPKWKVVTVDASHIIESAGALHCLTMNLGPLGDLPKLPRPQTPKEHELGVVAECPPSPLVANGDESLLSTFRDTPFDMIESWQPSSGSRAALMPQSFRPFSNVGAPNWMTTARTFTFNDNIFNTSDKLDQRIRNRRKAKRVLPRHPVLLEKDFIMLVLSRRLHESIVIGCETTITVLSVQNGKVRLGVSAPPHVEIHRQEVWDRIHTAPGLAAGAEPVPALWTPRLPK